MSYEVLRREVERKGGVGTVAEALNVTPAAVYYWLSGKREPSDKLLNYLGLKRVTRLVKA